MNCSYFAMERRRTLKTKKKQTNKNTQTNRQTKPKQKKIYKRASEENNTYAQ